MKFHWYCPIARHQSLMTPSGSTTSRIMVFRDASKNGLTETQPPVSNYTPQAFHKPRWPCPGLQACRVTDTNSTSLCIVEHFNTSARRTLVISNVVQVEPIALSQANGVSCILLKDLKGAYLILSTIPPGLASVTKFRV
jgi:hypothetical protein